MESRNLDKKIDDAAQAAKKVVAKVDETRRTAEELADAAVVEAQSALEQASKKGEHRLTEGLNRAAHRLQETVTKLANRAEEWADKTAARTESAARSSRRAVRKLTEHKK